MSQQVSTYYRCRSFNVNTLDSLCNDTLYFAEPKDFNDPLDCQPTILNDSSSEELQKLLTALICRRVKSEVLASLNKARLKGDGPTKHANKIADREARTALISIAYNATDPEYGNSKEEDENWLLVSHIKDELQRHYERGICCFSATYSDPLLWSHYGEQHRGLCIGYGLDRNPKPEMHRVIYGGDRSVHTSLLIAALVHNDVNAQKELDHNALLRKAKSWSYEQEYRLLGSVGEQESPLLLKEVTFGLRCPKSVRHVVVKALDGRDSQIDYYEMCEVQRSFELRRREFDLSELAASMPKTAYSGIEIFGDLIVQK